MGQSAAGKLLSVPENDELCACVREKFGGSLFPVSKPVAEPGTPSLQDGLQQLQSPHSSREGSHAATPRSQAGSSVSLQERKRGGRPLPPPLSSGVVTPVSPKSREALTPKAFPEDEARLENGDLFVKEAAAPSFTPRGIIGDTGAFSSYARPLEVEYRDANGDWTTFVRNVDGGGVDLLVDGELLLCNLTHVQVEGLNLIADGTNPNNPMDSSYVSPLVPDGAGDGRRGLQSRQDLYRRLDRNEDDVEDPTDWAHIDLIVRQVMSLFGYPEALAVGKPAESASGDPGDVDDANLEGEEDMTPDGFRVLWTHHERVVQEQSAPGRSARTSTVRSVGYYFFFDATTCPRFTFSGEPYEVEQWRGGRCIWSGLAFFWKGSDGLYGPGPPCNAHGCRWPHMKAAYERQWQIGDTVFVVGHHTDSKAFRGVDYKSNLVTYENALGCREDTADIPAGAQTPASTTSKLLTPSPRKSPRKSPRALENGHAGSVTRSSSSSSLQPQGSSRSSVSQAQSGGLSPSVRRAQLAAQRARE